MVLGRLDGGAAEREMWGDDDRRFGLFSTVTTSISSSRKSVE